MTDIVLFPDTAVIAINYIRSYYPNDEIVMFSDSLWEWNSTLIEIAEVGGSGRYEDVWGRVFMEGVITINVSNPDSVTASRLAREIHALLLEWDSTDSQIHRVSSVSKPVYYPNQKPYVPSYQLTISVVTEGTSSTISEMS